MDIKPMNQVTIKRFAEISGYTPAAVRSKIFEGVWIEGKHYYKAPDRHVIIVLDEVEKWQRNER